MLNHDQALNALITHVSAAVELATITSDDVIQWQNGVLEAFLAIGLLKDNVIAQTLVCHGCENQCFMPVSFTDDAERAFIVCEHPDQQAHMGRINVPLDRLQQWQVSARQFAGCVAALLDIDGAPKQLKNSDVYRLGMLPSMHGRRWVSLTAQPLAIEISGYTVPLVELLYFNADTLCIDKTRIEYLLNSTPAEDVNTYTPDTSRRDARKLATQAMYQDWHDEYLRIKQQHPTKKDTWISMQIAKLPIAKDRDSETIRHNMKKPRKLD